MPKVINTRRVDHDCSDIFPARWSPRAMSGMPLSDAETNALFEAARWAPSCNNSQSWRFLYAKRETEHWEKFFNLLKEGNKLWCINAGMLIVIVAKKTFDSGSVTIPTFAFDTGAAWENLALQASLMGLVAHGMAGFDYAAARSVLRVPDDHDVMAMVAVGKPGEKEDLPPQLIEREKPSDRKRVDEFAGEGCFKVSVR
ncbi:MAG: nitroreductase family protein [Chitinispirillaceae bacterium]